MAKKRITTIELFKEEMKFSSGHFTIFSSTERERLHGHNFRVYVALDMVVGEDGLTADYRPYKKLLIALFKSLNEYFLLPTRSKHLFVEDVGEHYRLTFAQKSWTMLKEDCKLLPVANITLEELSRYLLKEMIDRLGKKIQEDQITRIQVKVSSDMGQWGCAEERLAPQP